MKKKILLLIISLILIPTFVFAKDTCNDNDIKIKSISLKELNGFSEEVQESSVNNNTINLNLKMYDVGDSSTYYITVENTSSEDYYFTKDSMKLENDYLEYSLRNDSEVIPAKNEKTIELKVSYKNKIPNESYSDTSKLIISLLDMPLNNPETKMNYTFIFIIIILIAITIYTKINNKSFSKKKLLLAISFLSVIPISTTALCKVNLNIETKIEIENKDAIFLPGSEVNIKMKELAGDDTSTVTNGYNFLDQNIISIKYSNFEPIASNKEEKNIVSTPDSPYPIYMWFEDGTIYWWSEDKTPALNKDASFMFAYTFGLNDISGISSFDITNTKHLFATFCSSNLLRLDSLKKWDVSNVTNMQALFAENKLLESMEGIEKWNVSNVTNLSYLFENCYSLEEVDFSNWSTSSLKTINNMLGMWNENHSTYTGSKLRKIILSESFETSKVENMYAAFANNTKIEDYSFLLFLDMSNVTNASHMFLNNHNLRNLNELKDWDTSNMENIFQMFAFCTSLEDISAIKNWNVGKVTNFSGLFYENNNLYDASPINDWNISSEASFINMFYNVPTHPEFSAISGSWNYGTFIPS